MGIHGELVLPQFGTGQELFFKTTIILLLQETNGQIRLILNLLEA